MQGPQMIVPWQQKVNSLCVGIAGCSGTGKTELAEQIKDFADLPLIPDGIKGFMENNRLIRNTMGERQILKMYMSVLSEKKTIERAATRFVAIGTVLDYMSDILATMAHNTDHNGILDGLMQEVGLHTVQVYDIIFMMPFKLLDRGDDVFRATQHMLTTQGVMESQPLVLMHPIQSDSPSDQAAEALEVIERVTLHKAQVHAKMKGEELPKPKRVN